MQGGKDAEGKADGQRDRVGDHCKPRRISESVDNHAQHRLVLEIALAHVSGHKSGNPLDILRAEPLVHAKVVPDRLDGFRVDVVPQHEGDRVARNDVQNEKRDDADGKQNAKRKQDPLYQIMPQCLTFLPYAYRKHTKRTRGNPPSSF